MGKRSHVLRIQRGGITWPRRCLPDPPKTGHAVRVPNFRGPVAHGSTLRSIVGFETQRRVLTLSGGPGDKGDVAEVRLWDPETGAHLGRLVVQGRGGVSLALDEELGVFYLGTRQGEIQMWCMEAVSGLRTYNAGADGTGR